MLPIVLCLSDASLVIADNCNALGLIPPPARRSASACLISYVNYRGTCKVSNLSLFVTQFRSRVGRFESSTGILSISVILVWGNIHTQLATDNVILMFVGGWVFTCDVILVAV